MLEVSSQFSGLFRAECYPLPPRPRKVRTAPLPSSRSDCSPFPVPCSYSTTVHVESTAKAVIPCAIVLVSSPRSFWYTTPVWSTVKVITPLAR